MKKRNIIAVLATLVAALTLFAACGGNEQQEEPSTVIGADGQVYEEVTEVVTEVVTEIVSELKTEIVTEIKTEPKTDKKGEAVTNNKGVTEVVTEIVTEIVSEIVTEIKTDVVTTVVTVTVPYEPPTTTEKADEDDTTTGSETSSTVEDQSDYMNEETLPEGEKIDVPLDGNGQPRDPLMKRIIDASAKSKQFYLDCVAVTSSPDVAIETGIPYKLYMSENNFACEFSYGTLKMRMVVNDGAFFIIFPAAKAYYQAGSAEDANVGEVDMNIWDTIASAEMNYVDTQVVSVGNTKLTCETYTDSANTNKYYFDSRQQLKRIEIIPKEGEPVIFKVNSCSSKVDDSVFDVPKGYTPLTEEALQKLMGTLQ